MIKAENCDTDFGLIGQTGVPLFSLARFISVSCTLSFPLERHEVSTRGLVSASRDGADLLFSFN